MKPLNIIFTILFIFIFQLNLQCAETEGWISLFDGNSLTGWKANEGTDCFTVVDGAIVCNGSRSHLFYEGDLENATFQNFELMMDVMTKPGANSGVFIHTAFQDQGWPNQGYEVQVNNTQLQHEEYLEHKKTGSLYGIRNVYQQLVHDNEWFSLHITVKGKTVQVRINDTLVVNYTEPQNPFRPGRTTNWILSKGTLALQCHDPESTTMYKNISIKPLPNDATFEDAHPPLADDLYKEIIQLGTDNFPLIDLHTHLKGGLTIDDVLKHTYETGIYHGIAANCGVGFPIQDDASVEAFIESLKGKPVLIAMQAEGREWVNMFSQEAIQKFDYVFTDSMTFTDDEGRRTRLWIPEETFVGDKQQFMDMLVDRTLSVLNNEPINIYVNPTYLPAEIADEYDTLWTKERMQKVIDAAVKNGIAVEINSRFKLPSETFIKLAKQSGVKFTLGTNNGGSDDLGRLEYSLDMVKKCKLTWKDMFVPQAKIR
jgi:hypothetical protein